MLQYEEYFHLNAENTNNSTHITIDNDNTEHHKNEDD